MINIISDLKSTAILTLKKKSGDIKMVGNAVTVNVIEAIAERLIPLIADA